MIQQVKIQNFRNIDSQTFHFSKENFIYWQNGAGKTNILESLSIFDTPLVEIDTSMLVKTGEENLYIEILLEDGKKVSFFYEKATKKKKVAINGKSTTKIKIHEIIPRVVSFHPLGMNMMYLWPSKRRDFLDSVLIKSYPKYASLLRQYKKIITSRNKVLKNIFEWKSSPSELDFWDNSFIQTTSHIYKYRNTFINTLQADIHKIWIFFQKNLWDNVQIDFIYQSKIDRNNPETEIKEYLEKNRKRDIFLGKTHVWPHVDDFDILVNSHSLVSFGSRWEIKSSIIQLKLIEADFIEKITWKKPIIAIDDLMSELDEEHKKMVFENITDYQIFITSITPFDIPWNKIYL